MTVHSIAVVGGCNIDASATAFAPLVGGDSNPGSVRFSLGGVGRNIAENLARLSQRVQLVSALGDDHFTEALKRRAQQAGYDMSLCAFFASSPNSVYICVNAPDGEMSVAVNDMRICERITPAFLQERLPYLSRADAVVLDANLPEESIRYIATHCAAPLFADTVSTKKAARLVPALPRLHTLKTNRIEAQLLTGIEIRGMDDVRRAAESLRATGVGQVLITLGAQGAYASDGRETMTLPSLARDIVNTTGCGDAFFAGAVAASVSGQPLRDVLLSGLGMAALCAMDTGAVSQTVTADTLSAFLRKHEGGTH